MTTEVRTTADVIRHTAEMCARMSGLDGTMAATAAMVVAARPAHRRQPGWAVECEAADLTQSIDSGVVIADATGVVAVVLNDGVTWVSPALIEEVSTALDYARMRWADGQDSGGVEP